MTHETNFGIDSYILNSQVRSEVLGNLAITGPATPTQIANSTDRHQPHVSRALSELSEKDVVELLVPESQQYGRYYGLTDSGENTWERIEDRIRRCEWTITDPNDEWTSAIVEFAQENLGDDLRLVGIFDGREVEIVYIRLDVSRGYSKQSLDDTIQKLTTEHSMSNMNLPQAEYQYELKMFDKFSILRLRTDDEIQVSISFEPTRDISLPSFARKIVSKFE